MSADGPHEAEVRTEIPGTVLRVGVAAGDVVARGDEVALLESMKMEIPVLTEIAGTVVSVAVKEGDVVQGGDLIAVIERAE